MRWIAQLFARLLGAIALHPAVGYVIRTAIAVALVLVAARIGYSIFIARGSPPFARGGRGAARLGDWLATAQRFAAQGDYTAAAHALYLALITAAARRGLVSLHESKTAGDYLRELRQGADTAVIAHFADFTRSYETVIYGIGACDSGRYSRLYTLAEDMLGTTAEVSA